VTADWHHLGRLLHVGSGFAAVGLGLAVMLLPKFGRHAGWHRRLGRVYAALIAGSCLLGVPLAYRQGNTYLMALGAVTLAVVVAGWLAGRVARSVRDREAAAWWLRRHLILMGASYVGGLERLLRHEPGLRRRRGVASLGLRLRPDGDRRGRHRPGRTAGGSAALRAGASDPRGKPKDASGTGVVAAGHPRGVPLRFACGGAENRRFAGAAEDW